MHAVEPTEEEKAEKRPALRDFFIINGMPYEFTKAEVLNNSSGIVNELIDKGINPINIERKIVDDAYVPPEVAEVAAEQYVPPMPPAVQSALADLASKYTDPEVLADFEKVLRNATQS